MRSTRLTAIIGCILALVQAALAVESTVRLRFEIDTLRGFICLQARVNENREPEWFIFDTGANMGLALQSSAASRLNVSYDKAKWEAFSEYSTVRGGYRVPEATLRFDEDIRFQIRDATFVLSEDAVLPLIVVNRKFVTPAGFIGIGLFPKRYVKISYSTQELIVSTTPMELDGWQEVTTQYEEDRPFIYLKVGDEQTTALLDSGAEGGLSVSHSLLRKLVPDAKPGDPPFDFPTRFFPPTKLGEHPLNLKLIRVKEKERPYLLFGALEMLHYDWIINTDGMRVYAKRREPQPKIYTHMRNSVFLHVFPAYFEELGSLAFPVPQGALWRAGMRLEQPCRILTINGVDMPSKLEGTTSKHVQEHIILLAENPFTEMVHLRLRCEGQEREITFQLPPGDKVAEVLECIPFRSKVKWNIDSEKDAKVQLSITFSDARWRAFYRVNGQPVEQHNQEHPHKLVRVIGLPEEFSLADFFEHLHTQLSSGRSVILICLDEAGREVEVEIPTREQVKQEAVSEENDAKQQSQP